MKGEAVFLILDPFVSSLNSYSRLFVIASPEEQRSTYGVKQSQGGKTVFIFTSAPTSDIWLII